MNDRDRLIELLKNVPRNAKAFYGQFADYLIANGVVVLPCNIGDDLYWIDDENNRVRNHKNGVAEIIYCSNGVWKIKDTDGNVDKAGTQYAYLSREEAEKALKEGEWK